MGLSGGKCVKKLLLKTYAKDMDMSCIGLILCVTLARHVVHFLWANTNLNYGECLGYD